MREVYSCDGREYAKGFVQGLLVMAARGEETSKSRFSLARIAGADPDRNRRWFVRFKNEDADFPRSQGFHQFKIGARVRVRPDVHGDKDGHQTRAAH